MNTLAKLRKELSEVKEKLRIYEERKCKKCSANHCTLCNDCVHDIIIVRNSNEKLKNKYIRCFDTLLSDLQKLIGRKGNPKLTKIIAKAIRNRDS